MKARLEELARAAGAVPTLGGFTLAGVPFAFVETAGAWSVTCKDARLRAELEARFEPVLDPMRAWARTGGPLASGAVRAVVLEPNAAVRVRDFPHLTEARQYARDAAWESEEDRGSPVVALYDARLVRVA